MAFFTTLSQILVPYGFSFSAALVQELLLRHLGRPFSVQQMGDLQ
jgi:hypothetical protein